MAILLVGILYLSFISSKILKSHWRMLSGSCLVDPCDMYRSTCASTRTCSPSRASHAPSESERDGASDDELEGAGSPRVERRGGGGGLSGCAEYADGD